MSSWKTHLTAFLGLYAIIILTLECLELIRPEYYLSLFIGAPVGLVGSLAPDVDSGTSKIRKALQVLLSGALATFFLMFYATSDVTWAVLIILSILVLLTVTLSKHRGFFHSIKFLIISSTAVYFLASWIVALSWALGVFSHLILDKHIKM